MQQILAGKDEVINEASKKTHGRNREFIVTAKPYRNVEGQLLGIVESFQDITELKKAEMALRLSKRVIHNTCEAVIIVDLEKNIVDVNPAYSEILGYDKAEVVGRSLDFSLTEQHDEKFYQQLWRKVQKEGKWVGELWCHKDTAEVFPAQIRINTVLDEQGIPGHYVCLLSDISQRKETEKRMEELAFYDPLTHLPNRRLFMEKLQQELTAAKRRQTQIGLLFIDLDQFKGVNDSLGHSTGDELLVQVGERLKTAVRESDTVARMGGDEFTVIVTEVRHKKDLASLAEKLLTVLKAPVAIGVHDVVVGASIGIALFPENGTNTDQMMKNADIAMYESKAKGRNRFHFYSPEIDLLSQAHE